MWTYNWSIVKFKACNLIIARLLLSVSTISRWIFVVGILVKLSPIQCAMKVYSPTTKVMHRGHPYMTSPFKKKLLPLLPHFTSFIQGCCKVWNQGGWPRFQHPCYTLLWLRLWWWKDKITYLDFCLKVTRFKENFDVCWNGGMLSQQKLSSF